MSRSNAIPVPVVFPIGGLHEGAPGSAQPEGTSPDLLNVRIYHEGDRAGGGRRPGLELAFQPPRIGDISLGRRVTGLSGFADSSGAPTLSGGGNLVQVTDDLSANFSAYPNGDALRYICVLQQSGGAIGRNQEIGTSNTPGSDRLGFGFNNTGPNYIAFVAAKATTNDIEVTFTAKPEALAAPVGDQGTWHRCGCMVAMDTNLRNGIACRLERSGANDAMKLQIVEITDSASVVLVAETTTDTLSTPGTAYADDLIISLSLVGSTISAEASWASQGLAFSITAEMSDFSTDYSANVRSGFGFINGGTSITGISEPIKFFRQAVFSEITVAAPTALFSMRRTDASPGSNFFVPNGVSAVYVDESTNTVTKVDGPDSSATQSGDFNEIPCIDDGGDQLATGGSSDDNDAFIAFTTANDANIRPGVVLDINPAGTDAIPAFCTRVSDDGSSFIQIDANDSPLLTADINSGFFTYIASTGVTIQYYANGNLVDSDPIYPNGSDTVICRMDDTIVWIDDGTSIILQINGMNWLTITPNATDAAAVGDTNRTGLSFGRDSTGDAEWAGGFWFRVDSPTTVDLGDVNSLVVAFTKDLAHFGNIETESFTTASGLGLQNALPQADSFAKKVYAVDGDRSVIVDPALSTVSTWTASSGTIPAGCRLVAVYRGRLVIARQAANASVWYMSRTLDPLDWDFNAEPLSTAPYAGTTGAIGRPEDAIVGLVAWLDDYLLFMCAGSIWMMEGDPGFQGKVQNLSREVGLMGPRAWTFDDKGRLFFLSNGGGLMMLDTVPSQPVPVGDNRVIRDLNRLDQSGVLIQLAFNKQRQEVMIFLTPTDGETIGRHYAYDIRTDAFLPDTYPLSVGPWSVLNVRGDKDYNRGVLLGSDDGFVYRFRESVYTDAGQLITCYFDSAPIQPFGNQYEANAFEINGELGEGSGRCTWEVYTADSKDEVRQLTSSPDETGEWGINIDGSTNAGFQEPQALSARGGAHKVRVRQADTFTSFRFENAVLHLEPMSRRR